MGSRSSRLRSIGHCASHPAGPVAYEVARRMRDLRTHSARSGICRYHFSISRYAHRFFLFPQLTRIGSHAALQTAICPILTLRPTSVALFCQTTSQPRHGSFQRRSLHTSIQHPPTSPVALGPLPFFRSHISQIPQVMPRSPISRCAACAYVTSIANDYDAAPRPASPFLTSPPRVTPSYKPFTHRAAISVTHVRKAPSPALHDDLRRI